MYETDLNWFCLYMSKIFSNLIWNQCNQLTKFPEKLLLLSRLGCIIILIVSPNMISQGFYENQFSFRDCKWCGGSVSMRTIKLLYYHIKINIQFSFLLVLNQTRCLLWVCKPLVTVTNRMKVIGENKARAVTWSQLVPTPLCSPLCWNKPSLPQGCLLACSAVCLFGGNWVRVAQLQMENTS